MGCQLGTEHVSLLLSHPVSSASQWEMHRMCFEVRVCAFTSVLHLFQCVCIGHECVCVCVQLCPLPGA